VEKLTIVAVHLIRTLLFYYISFTLFFIILDEDRFLLVLLVDKGSLLRLLLLSIQGVMQNYLFCSDR